MNLEEYDIHQEKDCLSDHGMDSRVKDSSNNLRRRRAISYGSSVDDDGGPPSLALSSIDELTRSSSTIGTTSPFSTKKSKINSNSNNWYEHIPSLAEDAYVQGSLETSALQVDLAERNVEEMLLALTHLTTTTTPESTWNDACCATESLTEEEYTTTSLAPNDNDDDDSLSMIQNVNLVLFRDDDDKDVNRILGEEDACTWISLPTTTTSDDNDDEHGMEEWEEMWNNDEGANNNHDDATFLEDVSRRESLQQHLQEIDATIQHTQDMHNVVMRLTEEEQPVSDCDCVKEDDPKSRWYAQYSPVTGIYYFQPSTGNIERIEPDAYCDTSSVRRIPEQTVRSKFTLDHHDVDYATTTTPSHPTRVPTTTCRRHRHHRQRSKRFHVPWLPFVFLVISFVLLLSTGYFFRDSIHDVLLSHPTGQRISHIYSSITTYLLSSSTTFYFLSAI